MSIRCPFLGMFRRGLAMAATMALVGLAAGPASAAIFTVTTRADGGTGSLRWAIDQANGQPGPDEIHFNIAGPGPHVIELDSQLPHIDGHATEVRGDTQPGYSGRPLIALNGVRFGVVPFTLYRGGGLIVYGNDCLVRGLAFGGFREQPGQGATVRAGWHEYDEEHSCGVRLHGDNGRVEECHFGLDTTGQALTQNSLDAGNTTGVLVRGGTCRIERNLFGENARSIWLFDHRPGVTVRSNTFGLLRDGITPANPVAPSGAYKNIGVAGMSTRSALIRDNRFAGLGIGVGLIRRNDSSSFCTAVQIFGNQFGLGIDDRSIGLNAAIQANHYQDLQIGSESVAANRNRIGNTAGFTTTYTDLAGRQTVIPTPGYGIYLAAGNANVAGNTFGETSAGAPRPNLGAAITIQNPGSSIGSATVSIRNNRIVNGGTGVVTSGHDITTTLSQNQFVNLSGLAIDNGKDGATPPDPFDADTGPSGLQNQPVLQSITYDPATTRTRVAGVLSSVPNARYTIEVFQLPLASTFPPEAHTFLGSQIVTTDPFGNSTFAVETPGLYSGQAFTASATPADAIILGTGGTSELADAMVAPSGRFRIAGGGALTEGNGLTRTLTVTRSGTYGPATVSLDIRGSSPNANSADYTLSPGPLLQFANGEASKTITVGAYDDAINEPAELFTVELTGVINGLSATGVAVFSVADNDALPVLSVANVNVQEGQQAQLRLQLSAPTERTVTADYLWWNASAVFGQDFINVANGTATFPPRVTEIVLTADTVDDAESELEEWFGFSVNAVANATLAPENASLTQITITDNDTPPVTHTGFRFTWLVPAIYVGEGDGAVGLTVLRTGSLAGEARVTLRRVAGTASNADFTPNDDVELIFAAGEDAKVVPLGVVNDTLDETDETFVVSLANPRAALGTAALEDRSTLTIVITDNDSPPTVKLDTVSKAEGDVGFTGVELGVTLSAPSGREIALGLIAVGGTATDGDDFWLNTPAVVLAPGQTAATFSLTLVGDRIFEPDETVQFEPVILSGGPHPVSGATFTLLNDDSSKPQYELEGGPARIAESAGTVTLTLRRTGAIDDAGRCRVKIGAGEPSLRLEETDYEFLPGQQTHTVVLRVTDDSWDELDEDASLVILPAAPGEAPVSLYPLVIVDDDDPPTADLESPTVIVERDAGDTIARATVRLSAPSRLPIEIKLATFDQTALGATDYAKVDTVLTFAPGQTERTIEVVVHGDRLDESDETFLLLIISTSNAWVGRAGGGITIQDNDRPLRPYRDWLEGHFTPAERRDAGLTAPCADPDHDGLVNVIEFYLDTDPRSPLSGPDRLQLIRQLDSMLWVIDGLTSRAAFANPTLEESVDLASWGPLTRAEETIAEVPPDQRRHKVLARFTEPKLFLRLRGACREFEPEP